MTSFHTTSTPSSVSMAKYASSIPGTLRWLTYSRKLVFISHIHSKRTKKNIHRHRRLLINACHKKAYTSKYALHVLRIVLDHIFSCCRKPTATKCWSVIGVKHEQCYLLFAFLPAATGTLLQDFWFIITLLILCGRRSRSLQGGPWGLPLDLLWQTGQVSCGCGGLWSGSLFPWSCFLLPIRHPGTTCTDAAAFSLQAPVPVRVRN